MILRTLANALVILLLVTGLQPAIVQSQEMGDPLYDLQWHLKNTGQLFGIPSIPGEDINVEPVWEKTLNDGLTKIRGQGTYIAIVDDDLPFAFQSTITQALAHPDLRANISTQHSVDYYPSVIDTDRHATAVAGIAAARGYNGVGVRGVAPEAKIYGLNILGIPSGVKISANTREIAVLDAMVRHRVITAVSNNSWGARFPFSPMGLQLRAWEMAIETGIAEGFHGKGLVYIWAAGNDRCVRGVCDITNSNYDGFTKHYATVPVCAVDNRGEHASYSQLGANLWVCAPSRGTVFTLLFRSPGIATTSRGTSSGLYAHDIYTDTFGGTSAATPMVSGVVALMRQVNPSLSWRDVKLILANSARQNDLTDDGWMQGAVKYGLSSDDADAQYHFNHKYGFGVVNAEKAVEMAEGWINLPAAAAYTEIRNRNLNLRLTTDNRVINSEISVQSDINFIEHVEIPIGFAHPLIQDLSVKLTSPSGTTSSLFIPSTHPISSNSRYAINVIRGIWTFGSSVHLGEDPSGVWKLRFEDTRATTGTLIEWGMRIRGYQIKTDAAPVAGLSDGNVAETPLILSLIGASWEKDLQPNDFSLQNAPAGLRIASVSRTSDTQVQLDLALDDGFARDYLFQVIATTSTVPNIRNPLVSNDIPIVPEKAPMLEIISLPKQTIVQGSTTNVVVSVSDEDFDVNDEVVVTARSSNQTIISVMPMQTNPITTNTRITFVLTAERSGTATIKFFSIDSQGLSDSETVPVRVNAPPTISSVPTQSVRLLDGTETMLNVTVSDADADDSLTLLLTAIDESQDIVELVTTSVVVMNNGSAIREAQTLTIKGLKAGMTTLNITVSDEHTKSVPVYVSVIVVENTAPTIMAMPSIVPTMQLHGTTNVVVSVLDENFDVKDRVVVTARSSSQTIVSVTTSEQTNNITTNTRITFVLTAEQSGTATIKFFAIDSQGLSDSETVSVRVNTPPQVLSVPTTQVATVEEPFELKISEFFADVDGDVLRYEAVGLPESIRITTTGILIGVPVMKDASTNKAGFTVTVSADDSNGGKEQATFTLLINAKPSGSVSIKRDEEDRWLLSSTSTIVDDNGIATTDYRWYRNDMPIEVRATSSTYTIPDNDIGRAADTSYRLEVTIVDNIGQSVTTQSNTITIANEAPVIESIPALQINEGTTQNISISVGDANHDDLSYIWTGDSEVEIDTNKNSATLTIPPDFIKDAASTKTTVNLKVMVSDEVASTTGRVPVEVIKRNNGEATLGISITVDSNATTLTAWILSDDPDGGTSGTVVYQWQACEGSKGRCPPENKWNNIKEATSTTYIILNRRVELENDRDFDLVEGDSIFRIRADYDDGQGYPEVVYSAGRVYTARPAVRIRAKVFLEGSLQ